MKTRLRAAMIAAILALSLVTAFASTASAAPRPVGPDGAECSAYHTISDSGWFYFNSNQIWEKVRIEQVYTPGGGNCNTWRVVQVVGTSYAVTKNLQSDFCLSGSSCGYFYNNFDFSFPGNVTYNFPGPWEDLTFAPGCRWSGRGTIQGYGSIYSPYICV